MKISRFVTEINEVIRQAMQFVIDSVDKSGLDNIFVSKYHSFYVLAGIVLALYKIDAENL